MVAVIGYETNIDVDECLDSVTVFSQVDIVGVLVFDSRYEAEANAAAIRKQFGRKASVKVMTVDALMYGEE